MSEHESHYDNLHEGGSECTTERAYIMIYPNTSYEEDHFLQSSDDIPTALDGAFNQLLNANVISYYDISILDTSVAKYPDFSNLTDRDTIEKKFQNYLTTDSSQDNGTGTNLKDYKGLHLFVHSSGCNQGMAGGEYADDKCGDSEYSAFSRGVMGWTGAECNTHDGMRKNSAIQEVVHGFIRYKGIDRQDLCHDSSNPAKISREHRLGKVNKYGRITPMLTYHDNESDIVKEGKCEGYSGNDNYDFTQTLTSCTETAVEQSANRMCINQTEPDYCDNIQ